MVAPKVPPLTDNNPNEMKRKSYFYGIPSCLGCLTCCGHLISPGLLLKASSLIGLYTNVTAVCQSKQFRNDLTKITRPRGVF